MTHSQTFGGIPLGGIASFFSPDELEGFFVADLQDPSGSDRTRADAKQTLVRMFLERLPPWRSADVVEEILQGLLDGKTRSDLLPSPSGPGRPRKTAEIAERRRAVDTLRSAGCSLERAAELAGEQFGVAPETIKRRHYARED